MKSAHKVKAYRNNTDTAGKAAFLGSYLTKETVDIEKLCEQVSAQSGLTAIQVRAILEGSFDAIAELEKEGLVIVHLDGLTVMAVITGSLGISFPMTKDVSVLSRRSLGRSDDLALIHHLVGILGITVPIYAIVRNVIVEVNNKISVGGYFHIGIGQSVSV